MSQACLTYASGRLVRRNQRLRMLGRADGYEPAVMSSNPRGGHRLSSARCIARHKLTLGYDHAQFYVLTGVIDDEDPAALVGEAFDNTLRVAQGETLIVVLSPHQNNFKMKFSFERWDGEPPADNAAWQEVCEAFLDVEEWGLMFGGTFEDVKLPALPPGRYAARICGRGFVAHGWPGSTAPGDAWRLQVWPADERFPPRRLASWSGPEGLSEVQSRVQAIKDAARNAAGRPEPFALIRDALGKGTPYEVRWAAVDAIAEGWPGDPDAGALLKELAVRDADLEVRCFALKGLAAGWPDTDTLAFLRQVAESKAHRKDQGDTVRSTAASCAAVVGAGDPDVLAWLKGLVVDAVRPVRGVLSRIAEGWKDDATLTWLRELATTRGDATGAICSGWAGDPELVTWWMEQAQSPVVEVRAFAVLNAGAWRAYPEVLAILKQLANAPSPIRQQAMGTLSKSWSDDDSAHNWLCDVLDRDFPNGRPIIHGSRRP